MLQQQMQMQRDNNANVRPANYADTPTCYLQEFKKEASPTVWTRKQL